MLKYVELIEIRKVSRQILVVIFSLCFDDVLKVISQTDNTNKYENMNKFT